jgi:hypothetical protein
LGTVVETVRPSVLPSSSIAGSIRQSDLGWRESARLGLDPKAYLFAVDYQIAAQLRYYTGLDVQTGWDQYKLWEMPPVCGSEGAERDVQLIALPYLDQEVLSERIEAAFRDVRGPVRLYLGSQERNALYVWTARGCVVDQKTFLDWFDYLTLAAAGGDR